MAVNPPPPPPASPFLHSPVLLSSPFILLTRNFPPGWYMFKAPAGPMSIEDTVLSLYRLNIKCRYLEMSERIGRLRKGGNVGEGGGRGEGEWGVRRRWRR